MIPPETSAVLSAVVATAIIVALAIILFGSLYLAFKVMFKEDKSNINKKGA